MLNDGKAIESKHELVLIARNHEACSGLQTDLGPEITG